jgi:hypothetical protein
MYSETGSLSRRQVIAGLSSAVAVSACSGSISLSPSGLSVVQSSSRAALNTQTSAGVSKEVAAWQGLVGSMFNAGSHTLKLTGVEVQPTLGTRPANLRLQSFVTTFEVIQGGTLQGDLIYTIANDFDIFLTGSATGPSQVSALFA